MLHLPFAPAKGDNAYTVQFQRSHPSLPGFITVGWEIRGSTQFSQYGMDPVEHYLAGILLYTLSGRGVLERDGMRYELEPGQAFMVERPDDYRYYLPVGWEPWEFLYLAFDGDDALHHFRLVREMYGTVISLEPTHPVIEYICEIGTEIYHQRLQRAEAGAEHLYRLMMALRQLALPPNVAPVPALLQAIQFANNHYADNISVKAMAEAAGMSLSHFCRLFREQTGRTPHSYLTWVRLQSAVILLKQTTLSLEEIGQRCGFHDRYQLGKVFRRVLGITPLGYRKNASILPAVKDWNLVSYASQPKTPAHVKKI